MSKKTINILLRSTVSIILLTWLGFSIDWPQLVHGLRTIKLAWILVAIGWIIVSIVISTWKWRGVLQAQGLKLQWKELWNAYWEGQFFNNFLPSSIGGDAMRIIRIGRLCNDHAGATASVVIERILATVGLAITGILGGILVKQPDYRIISIFIVIIIFCVLLLVAITRGHLPAWVEQRSGRLVDFLKRMQIHGRSLQGQGTVLLWVTLLSVGFQAAVVGVNYCIFQALNIKSVGSMDALYIIPLISVAAMLPFGINGYGIREGAYVALLSTYSVDRGTAFLVSLLFAFLVSLCSLYGAWIWLIDRSKEVMTDV